jgi:eukaryotic-like serine/threonine-protein kinase
MQFGDFMSSPPPTPSSPRAPLSASERFRLVADSYAKVADLPAGEREGALKELERQDAEAAREVRELLAQDRGTDSFMKTPVLGARVDVWAAQAKGLEEDLSGEVAGHYRLVRRIASGGMGTVYEAERADGQFQQRVAVKLVKRGLDSDEVLKRFAHERQTLAALNHASIAKLLDGGATDSGRPYLVMELVDGQPIDEFAREQGLNTEAKIRLFLKVCEAVHYAHQNLVVHRDIKPQNVLVGESGLPKLVDFGVAKVLGDAAQAGITIEAGSRFTPEYASPEQVMGLPVTTSTDVYSLGVLLYELLAGRPPYVFSTRSAAELRTLVCEQDPPPPSAARPRTAPGADAPADPAAREQPSLRGDLDRIVLMAMRKEPHRRYASAEQLAADLQRYLDGRPVLARPNTIGYVARKFVRRNAAPVAAAALLLVLLVAGSAGIAVKSREAARQRDIAIQHREQSEAVTKFLREMLAQADPGVSGPNLSVREFLDVSAARAMEELTDKSEVLGAVLSTIARTYMNLGLLEQAEPLLERAMEIRRADMADHPDELVEAHSDMGTLRFLQRRFAEAEHELRAGLKLSREVFGPRHATTGQVLNNLGAVLRNQGKAEEAESALVEALAIRQEALGADHADVAETMNNLSLVVSQRGDMERTEELLRGALEIRRKRLDPEHPMVIQALDNLAVVLLRQGKTQEAEPLQDEALELARRRYPPDHPTLAIHLHNTANGHVMRQKPAEAEPLLREAIEIAAAHFGEDHGRTALYTGSLGRALMERKRFAEAEALLLQTWSRLQERQASGEWEYIRGHLESLYRQTGDEVKAGEFRDLAGARGG